MSETEEPAIPVATRRRRRGVAKASITKLTARLDELETRVEEPSTLGHAHKLSAKLDLLDSEFKGHHFAIVDAIAEDAHVDENLAKEQDELDQHDAIVADLTIRLESLTLICSSKEDSAAHRVALRTLANRRERLIHSSSDLAKLSGAPEDTDVLEQYREQVAEHKKELSDTRQHVLSTCSPAESDTLVNTTIVDIDKLLFDICLTIRKKSRKTPASADDTTVTLPEARMVKLPKLEAPTFDGNILHWLTFWEQFRVAIHDRDDLSKAQKLVYLRQSLKEGSAKNAIEGLSRSGEQYDEAIKCLRDRYNRPRLIHEAHVRRIIEVPHLRDNTDRELRRLHA